MDFVCPRCQHRYQGSDNLVGKEVRCKNAPCEHVFKVVPAQATTSGVAAPPGDAQAANRGGAAGGSAAPPAVPRIPAGMPPMPASESSAKPAADALGFLSGSGPSAIDGRTQVSREGEVSRTDPAAIVKRPAGVVWIVFYWIVSGVLLVVGGVVFSGLLGFALGAAGARQGVMPLEARSLETSAVLALMLVEAIALLVFHLGLITLVACYGLWTFRAWGLSLAKLVAFLIAALNLIGLVICLVTRLGIVGSLANSCISVGILVYLYGGGNLASRLQRYSSGLRGIEQSTWRYE